MPTDTSEKGLESLIVDSLVSEAGYVLGSSGDFDRDHAVDLVQLATFLVTTQPQVAATLNLGTPSPRRTQFLHRLQGDITKHGLIDVLRKGVKDNDLSVDLFYGAPSLGNARAAELFAANVFSVTRQLRYSKDETRLALDLCLFINGLPVATFELKNSLTKQTVDDAVQQYKRDRDARELLFQFGRCMVHFAVDDSEVRMCTELKGGASWFLPFNKGWNDGAGNPPNPAGIKTDYLWKQTLSKQSLTDIIENYAQITYEKGEKGRKTPKQVFPRYHQLDAVRRLLAAAAKDGVGKRYLIQHSAGSGKSNSIAWLVHQLVGLGDVGAPLFDSVIVITDRVNLDSQIKDTIKNFAQVAATIGHADHSGDLRRFLQTGKKIIISTVQKFPFILDDIGSDKQGRKFAIVIDEAHSSQGGKTTSAMHTALGASDVHTAEDDINAELEARMKARKMLSNASYFAFTATPKNKTLELFGAAFVEGDVVKHRAFHSYTMKQAIQEGFILDVLRHYTPVESYYRLVKAVEDDPEFDTKKAQKKLRRYVESHDHAIRQKAEIMVDHFCGQVLAKRKIGGQARAMVVCNGIERAIQTYRAVSAYLNEIGNPFKAIVAYSGEHEVDGKQVTEAQINGFASAQIETTFRQEPYRFLIVADKFQTGYDEPLLHTMYVDKPLAGIKAVQTLSRLNRAHPQKTDTFVLDFANDVDTITFAFQDYYRTTVLSGETDPNKLHDLKAELKAELEAHQVFNAWEVEQVAALFISGAARSTIDPILDKCVAIYKSDLDENGQIDFKGKAKAFLRTYQFLAAILPFSNADWERLSIFLNFLVPKLPAPKEEDLSVGVLESIDMESYRAEVKKAIDLALSDDEGEIEPVPSGGGGFKADAALDLLSNIVKAFNEQFGNIAWNDSDRIRHVVTVEIPAKVAEDQRYKNAMANSDKESARLEFNRALQEVIVSMLSDHTDLFKHFQENASFSKWLGDTIFNATYKRPAAPAAS